MHCIPVVTEQVRRGRHGAAASLARAPGPRGALPRGRTALAAHGVLQAQEGRHPPLPGVVAVGPTPGDARVQAVLLLLGQGCVYPRYPVPRAIHRPGRQEGVQLLQPLLAHPAASSLRRQCPLAASPCRRPLFDTNAILFQLDGSVVPESSSSESSGMISTTRPLSNAIRSRG